MGLSERGGPGRKVGTSAVTGALLVVTMFAIRIN